MTLTSAPSNEDLSLKMFQDDTKDMNDIIKLDELVKSEANGEPKQAQSPDHTPQTYNFDQPKSVEEQMEDLIGPESMEAMWNDDSEEEEDKESGGLPKAGDSSSVF